MTKGQLQGDAKPTATSTTSQDGGGAGAVVVGNVPSGKRTPVILCSVAWVAWIVFLVCMLAM